MKSIHADGSLRKYFQTMRVHTHRHSTHVRDKGGRRFSYANLPLGVHFSTEEKKRVVFSRRGGRPVGVYSMRRAKIQVPGVFFFCGKQCRTAAIYRKREIYYWSYNLHLMDGEWKIGQQ